MATDLAVVTLAICLAISCVVVSGMSVRLAALVDELAVLRRSAMNLSECCANAAAAAVALDRRIRDLERKAVGCGACPQAKT